MLFNDLIFLGSLNPVHDNRTKILKQIDNHFDLTSDKIVEMARKLIKK